MDLDAIGGYAFIAGILISLGLGIGATAITLSSNMVTGLVVILVLLGLIVGFVNVTKREMRDFLIAVIAIGIIGSANLDTIPYIGNALANIVAYIAVFVAPAALVVAIKEVLNLGKS